MNQSENTFPGFDGIKLFYQSWLPKVEPKAAIIIVHGGGDHSGRFGNVVNFLVPNQYAVYALDWRGHGQSPGIRGHVDKWVLLRDDLGEFIKLINEQHPTIPLFLFGHSMGGVIVLDYCLHDTTRIHGVICTSPAIGQLGISPVLWQIAKLLDRIWPSLSFPTRLDITKLTHDNGFIRYTKNDPLYHRKASPRFGMEVKKTVDAIHQNADKILLPMFLVHGTADEIVSIEGSRTFVQNSNNSNLEYMEYEGGYHELFNDTMKEKVLGDILDWLDKIAILSFSILACLIEHFHI
jgi:alpha-beta hydrolase superfamily lysophospholipase